MVKKISWLIAFFIMAGCSSDDDAAVTQATDVPPPVSTFSISVNGINRPDMNARLAMRIENQIVLVSDFMELSFDKDGHFGYVKIDLNQSTPNQTNLFYSYNYYSSHFLAFNLISLDEANKRVKGTLTGVIYHNPLDITSEGKYIEIAFDYTYKNVIPFIANLRNEARINGVEWKRTNYYTTSGTDPNVGNITHNNWSDRAYGIQINYNIFSISPGNFNFTPSQISNNVKLLKFDTVTGTNIAYNCTGTLNISQKELLGTGLSPSFILSGTYSFTAVNPNDPSDVIQVTDGVFKLFHRNF